MFSAIDFSLNFCNHREGSAHVINFCLPKQKHDLSVFVHVLDVEKEKIKLSSFKDKLQLHS